MVLSGKFSVCCHNKTETVFTVKTRSTCVYQSVPVKVCQARTDLCLSTCACCRHLKVCQDRTGLCLSICACCRHLKVCQDRTDLCLSICACCRHLKVCQDRTDLCLLISAHCRHHKACPARTGRLWPTRIWPQTKWRSAWPGSSPASSFTCRPASSRLQMALLLRSPVPPPPLLPGGIIAPPLRLHPRPHLSPPAERRRLSTKWKLSSLGEPSPHLHSQIFVFAFTYVDQFLFPFFWCLKWRKFWHECL